MRINLFISCPKGIENQLQDELSQLGVENSYQTIGGIYGDGDFELIYTICLFSRLANRVVWVLDNKRISNKTELYQCVRDIAWSGCFPLAKSFSVDFKGKSSFIKHSNYGALLIKDAIVDHFYEAFNERPNVDPEAPDVRLYAHLRKDQLLIGIEVSGGSLHRRGYRLSGAKAPLKENLAAALMMRAIDKYPSTLTAETPIVDPMCGSATLLIEGALIVLGIAPGVFRQQFGFEHLTRHNATVWKDMLESEKSVRQQAISNYSGAALALGFDQDASVIRDAESNIKRAGLAHIIRIKQQSLVDFQPLHTDSGLLVCNPPYGERLEDKNRLFPVYQLLGERIKHYCQGWQANILSSDDHLLKAMALQKSKAYQYLNGSIPAQWLFFNVYKKEQQEHGDKKFLQGVEMVENRLKKNHKRLKKWLSQNEITAYRLYDADMPEYAFALDQYDDKFQLTEYMPPKSVDKYGAFQRKQQFERAVINVFNLKSHQLIVKERSRQKGKSQYEKRSESKHFFRIKEAQTELLVNLHDYLDTGLFLDHRPVRRMIQQKSAGKRVLNLFCYTATVSVLAAKGGAASSLSIDMSQTYLSWAEKNFRINDIDKEQHQLIRENCVEWLATQADAPHAERFDLIFLDPPSFSNSKRMEGTFDVQRDHLSLIKHTMALLASDGELLFSNNRRDFVLDEKILTDYDVKNISADTIDKDFERNPKIHQCWIIRHH